MRFRKDMHPEDIKAAIRKKGHTLTSLAEANNLSESAIRRATRRFADCPSAERVIAEYLGKSLSEIWPSRYKADGTRRIIKSKVECRKSYSRGHCQKRKVA